MVTQGWTHAHLNATLATRAAAECLVIVFFFPLHPGEYLDLTIHPPGGPIIRLCDIGLWINSRALDTIHCSDADLLVATFVCGTGPGTCSEVRRDDVPVRDRRLTAEGVMGRSVRRCARMTQGTNSGPGRGWRGRSCHVRIRPTRWPKCPCGRHAPAAPWRFCAPVLTATAFISSAAGGQTKCTVTCTFKLLFYTGAFAVPTAVEWAY